MKKLIVVMVALLCGCGGPAFTAVDGDSGVVDPPPPAVDSADPATDAGVDTGLIEVDSGSVMTADSGSAASDAAEASSEASVSMCCYVLGTALVRCDPSVPWFCVESEQSYAYTEPGRCTPDVMCTVSGLTQHGVVQACQ